MNRAEVKRALREEDKKKRVFTYTQAQLDDMLKKAYTDGYTKGMDDTAKKAFTLMLAVPLEVLIREDYWMKSAKKKMPKFINDVLDVYAGFEKGSISIEEMKTDLWNFAGIRVENE